eukprot:jgi/Psemu1/36665/gm1.36665_g
MSFHQSNMSNSDLKSLFPSFDLKLAQVLNATLDVPQEACNHICEVLIIAGASTWNHFICVIYEYAYIVDEYGVELEYQAQTDPRSTSVKDQHTLTSFVDFINDIIPQVGCYWYDHNQYNRDAFLAFCNARNQHPELTAVPTKANAAILASQPSVQAQSCLTKPPVLLPVSSSVSASDILTKHWSHSVVYPLLRPIFHFCGNTGDLLQDDGSIM